MLSYYIDQIETNLPRVKDSLARDTLTACYNGAFNTAITDRELISTLRIVLNRINKLVDKQNSD